VFEIPSVTTHRTNQAFNARGLSSLSSNIKSINAKLVLLKQDLTSTMSSVSDGSQQSVFDVYDSIGQDLNSLLDDWNSGRNELIHLLNPQSGPNLELERDRETMEDSGLGVSVSETEESRKRDSCGDWGFGSIPSPIRGDLQESFEEDVVLEGTAKGRNASTNLTRAQRIEKTRKEREDLAEKKRLTEERRRWLGELKDVLDRRAR
jgi:hypothetical protein